MSDHGPLDPEILRRMREILVFTITTRSASLREAAAEARGLARGLCPRMPITALDEAVTGLLIELDAHAPPPPGQRLRADAPGTDSPVSHAVGSRRHPMPTDPAFGFTVEDLACDQALRLPCACRVRTFSRRDLMALVGRDVRLHLIGLRRELWCGKCCEPPLTGWVIYQPAGECLHGSLGSEP